MHYNDQGADFKYLIVNERDKRFGLSVTTVGFQAIRAGSVYPPRNHPDAYYFTAQKGRVLHEYQLVYITKGRGTFASDTTPSVDISKGQILFLFPGQWHTYYPSRLTGWTEYDIGFENLRKLVNRYAAQTGGAKPVERPKSGIQKRQKVEDHKKRTQRMLLTWLTDEPEIYRQISKYIKPSDFTEELYGRVAQMLFADLSEGNYNPAAILSRFTEEEEQREVASMFHTKLDGIETKQDKEKALRDIVYAVKKNSYEYYTGKLGTDVSALQQVIDGKRALEELAKVHILLS